MDTNYCLLRKIKFFAKRYQAVELYSVYLGRGSHSSSPLLVIYCVHQAVKEKINYTVHPLPNSTINKI